MSLNVAIAGATGHLGPNVVRAFLDVSVYPSQVERVAIFTRNTASDSAQALRLSGAEVIEGEPTSENLKSIDVLVNLLSDQVSPDTRNSYAQAAIDAGVRVYFPNEFVADPRVLDFQHPVYKMKTEHAEYARDRAQGNMKVISVYSGQFLEYLFGAGALSGLDTINRIYTAAGDPNNKFSVTSTTDIGSALVKLSILATENPASVPDQVRLSGDAVSIAELAQIVGKERAETIEVKTTDAAEMKRKFSENPADLLSLIKYVFGSGLMDFSRENNNELVNPGEAFWKWKSVTDAVRENKGVYRPTPST
ncbi:hypothetical protein FRB90_002263 [Tulasnella sp. 427]|nr:hypothetical protein FRB90_002263 [Tulasnella sp. 427]